MHRGYIFIYQKDLFLVTDTAMDMVARTTAITEKMESPVAGESGTTGASATGVLRVTTGRRAGSMGAFAFSSER
jgi:hypothetical protein